MEEINDVYDTYTGFLPGYGIFPYVIWRHGAGIYMQLPIPKGKERTTQYLIDKTKALKARLEQSTKRNCKLCLVLAKNEAYYFSDDLMTYSESIPSGGLLLTKDGAQMKFNHIHFIENGN
jgi:hypothetical protein